MSYEQTLKAVDDILRTDAGCATPIDYIEQTSWILFLKYLSDLESERSDEAMLKGKEHIPLFTDEFKWDNWAVPKNDDGSQDIVNALTGDDLLEFVLGQYKNEGVIVLDDEKLPTLLELKYKSIQNAKQIFGDLNDARNIFLDFQKILYRV